MSDVRFLVPQGIGDSIWALHKVEDAARRLGASSIHILIGCYHPLDPVERRALEFVRRIRCVAGSDMYRMPSGGCGCMLRPGPLADEMGYYRYIDEGFPGPSLPGVDYVLIPNRALERGIRLEDWQPQFRINWDFVPANLIFTEQEESTADEFRRQTGPFVALHLGNAGGNCQAGHNRGPLWAPRDWVRLGEQLRRRFQAALVVCGADYDRSYYDGLVRPFVGPGWIDCIQRWSLLQTIAVLRRASFMVAYQSGLVMVLSYLGLRTAVFWRPWGDSMLPQTLVHYAEGMSTAWVRPDILERGDYIPVFYGRHGPDWIVAEIERRGW